MRTVWKASQRRVAIGIALALLALVPTRVGASVGERRGVRLVYDVYYLAFRVLAVESTTFLDGLGYRTHSHMQTVGLFGTLFPWESRSSAFGSIDGSAVSPGAYQVRSTFRGRSTAVDLQYGAGGSVDDHLSGDFGDGRRKPVPEDDRRDTLDPLTAAVAISQELAARGTCAGTQRVFDGVRRYDLSYEDRGDAALEQEGDVGFGGRARLCEARLEPIGGFLESGARVGESPRRITAWLAPVAAASTPVPVRLDFEGPSGTLHAYLQEAAPISASEPAPTKSDHDG